MSGAYGHSFHCELTFTVMFLLGAAVLVRGAYAATFRARVGAAWLAAGGLAGVVLPVKGAGFLLDPRGGEYLLYASTGIAIGVGALVLTLLALYRANEPRSTTSANSSF